MFPTLCASHERSFSAAREFFRRDLRWQVQEAKAQALEAGSYLRGSRCRTWRLSAAMNLKAAPMPSFLWLQDRGAIYKETAESYRAVPRKPYLGQRATSSRLRLVSCLTLQPAERSRRQARNQFLHRPRAKRSARAAEGPYSCRIAGPSLATIVLPFRCSQPLHTQVWGLGSD